MTQEQERPQRSASPPARAPEGAPTGAPTQALAEMVNAANALAAIQQQAAIEAMRLPEHRLDETEEAGGASPGYYETAEGTKVDADGNEVK